jgi:hypothetical protein
MMHVAMKCSLTASAAGEFALADRAALNPAATAASVSPQNSFASGAIVGMPTSLPSFISEEHPAPSKNATFLAFIASEMVWRAVSIPLFQSISTGLVSPFRKNLKVLATPSPSLISSAPRSPRF